MIKGEKGRLLRSVVWNAGATSTCKKIYLSKKNKGPGVAFGFGFVSERARVY